MRIKDLKVGDKVRCFGSTGAYLVEVENVVVDMTHYRDIAYVVNANNVKGTLTDNDEWIFHTDKVSNKKHIAFDKGNTEKAVKLLSNDVQQKKRFEHLGDALDGKENDIVNKPSHYTYGKIEIIDIVEQVTAAYPTNIAFSIGNALKYICRAPFKNGVEDLKKAVWYLNRAIEKWDVNKEEK